MLERMVFVISIGHCGTISSIKVSNTHTKETIIHQNNKLDYSPSQGLMNVSECILYLLE